ncbi:MAG: GTP cyclohydrolase II, partial [Sphingomonadales bacterium]
EDASRLRIVARARLPVAGAETSEIVAFRTDEMPGEHVALLIGTPNGQPPLVRLHSECLTGDVLGSLKCDCGPQLHAAIREIEASGWGMLLYLRQEGRGIGLINKLRAYALQDQGFDTVDANIRLGFAVDSRNFTVAARMLTLLGQREIRLLTNNPDKVAALEAAGVKVAERVAHQLPPNPHNERYLATKRDRTGHQL